MGTNNIVQNCREGRKFTMEEQVKLRQILQRHHLNIDKKLRNLFQAKVQDNISFEKIYSGL